jgi:hypothetical protein
MQLSILSVQQVFVLFCFEKQRLETMAFRVILLVFCSYVLSSVSIAEDTGRIREVFGARCEARCFAKVSLSVESRAKPKDQEIS